MNSIRSMIQLNKILERATHEHWAVGHFNISNGEQLRAIILAAKELSAPVMIGTSQGERDFIGLTQVVYLVKAFKEENPSLPIFLNADHSKTLASATAAIDAGYDSIHIDCSALTYEENLAITKKVVEYAKEKNAGIVVEGELGYLPGESKIQNQEIQVNKDQYTQVDQAVSFVAETGIDRLAIAVGNIHGISLNEPHIDIDRIKEIRARVSPSVSLVLHAGSGIPSQDIKNAIQAGIANIHINTEIRISFIEGLKKELEKNPHETTPYKLFSAAISATKEKVKEKLILFGSQGKIQIEKVI